MAEEVVGERSPARILQVRAKMYDLLSHCIPATTILKVVRASRVRHEADWIQTLTFKLIPMIDDALKADVVKWSAFYEHRIRMGSVCSPIATRKASLLTTLETHLPSRSLHGQIHENHGGVLRVASLAS